MSTTSTQTGPRNPSRTSSSSGTASAGDSISDIDGVIAAAGTYDLNSRELATLRLRLLRATVAYHHRENPMYASYCETVGFHPGMLESDSDLGRTPLIPSSVFKRHNNLSSGTGNDVLVNTSSGTMGTLSRVARCDVTLMRFFGTVASGIRELLGFENGQVRVLNLGPRMQEAEDLWISYVMAGIAVAYKTEYYVTGGNFDVEGAARDFAAADDPVAVVGPPALLRQLALKLRSTVVRPHPTSVAIAMGGWKRRTGEPIARAEFDALVAVGLGLAAENVRDAFNMVELNTVLLECAAHRKHVPPWVHVRARDPKCLSVVESGRQGILGYLDASARSYPAFVLSDDFGVVEYDHACECGRRGDVVAIVRRVDRVESRGCALKI